MTRSNYPPGMSGRDFVKAGIDRPHDHQHEFEPTQGENPIIEDGAVIFFEHCRYVEGEYGEGWSCDKERTYRFEEAWIEMKRKDEPNIIYLASEFDDFIHFLERGLIEVEMEGDVTDVDPDPDYGSVTVETEDWRVKYKADHQPQVHPSDVR